ncbi:TlpA family protein disulfide reductase [Sphingobacterium sp. WOUb80]|uniref:TlpA family protein disulfide reductase n=1 Tax=Sphingobacterium sp. WOUb80 TaxID=3234028 RepID=UPI003CF9F686
MKLVAGICLMLVAIFFFTACGNTDSENKGNTENGETLVNGGPDNETKDLIAGISFKDKDGKTVMLSSLKGKVVFINFWALWCPPCIEEIPSIHKLKQTFIGSQDIVFLMVDVDNKMDKSLSYMEKNKFDLDVFVPNSDIPDNYLGNAIPTTVILNKSGDMIEHLEGGRDYSSPEMVKMLKELVDSN